MHVSVITRKRRRDDEGDSVKEMRALVPPRVLQTMAHLATKRVGERDGRTELAERVGGREESESETDARVPAVSSCFGGEI